MLALLGVAALLLAFAAAASADITLAPVGTFVQPIDVAAPPGDAHRLFVVERAGRILLLVDGVVQPTPFLDITSQVGTDSPGDEGGLLSVAFAPDYTTSGRFYVYFTDPSGLIHVREYRRSAGNPNVADPTSGRDVLTIPHPNETNHYGGQLQFGPDGLLYIGVGDGGGEGDPAGNGQNPHVLLGKMLRIDPAASGGAPYTVPAGNPYVGRPAAGRAEIVAIGLRNPWRFSFDRATGAIWIGDVGQNLWEEVDSLPAAALPGANFGWSLYEGTHPYPPGSSPAPTAGLTMPVFEYSHSVGGCAIMGGYVSRDPSLPSLAGRYLYVDYCAGTVMSFPASDPAAGATAVGPTVASPVSFGQDACGHLYIVSQKGAVSRFVDSAGDPTACDLALPSTGGTGGTAGTGGAGGTGGSPSSSPRVTPTTAPRRRLLAGLRVPLSVSRGELTSDGIAARCSASLPGRCRVFAGLTPHAARRLHLPGRRRAGIVVIGGGAVTVTGAHAQAVRIRLSPAAARRLRRLPRGVSFALRLQVEVTASDGRAVLVRRVVRVRPLPR